MTTPDQVLAALEVLGWPDDRERSAHIEEDGYEVTPRWHYWDLVTSVLNAAAAAYVPSLLPEGMTEDEFVERFLQSMATQRITVPTDDEDHEATCRAFQAEHGGELKRRRCVTLVGQWQPAEQPEGSNHDRPE